MNHKETVKSKLLKRFTDEIAMVVKSQTEANISPWLLASLIFDSIWPLKNKLFSHEK